MSPGLPVTADEMTEQGKAAVEAGAAILHLHARLPEDGRPSVTTPQALPAVRVRACT
jgi:uncharacterized protein (DUF849 family)